MLKRTCTPYWTKRLTRLSQHADRLTRMGHREEAIELRKAIEKEHRSRALQVR